MPQCLIKSCKNNNRKNTKSTGVSYFLFPTNPFISSQWISIVAKERKDPFFRPAKKSVICSKHFDDLDIIRSTKRCRLVKTAVPKLQIPSQSTDSKLIKLEPKDSESDIEVQSLSMNQDQVEHIAECNSPVVSLSDLISESEIAKVRFLNKKLFNARKVIEIKSKKIQSLQKVNKRLVKRNISLKSIINVLKNKLNINEKLFRALSKNGKTFESV